MKKVFEAPTAEFVQFSIKDSIVTTSSCSGHCEVVCTDECESETCAPVCPDNCYVIY